MQQTHIGQNRNCDVNFITLLCLQSSHYKNFPHSSQSDRWTLFRNQSIVICGIFQRLCCGPIYSNYIHQLTMYWQKKCRHQINTSRALISFKPAEHLFACSNEMTLKIINKSSPPSGLLVQQQFHAGLAACQVRVPIPRFRGLECAYGHDGFALHCGWKPRLLTQPFW